MKKRTNFWMYSLMIVSMMVMVSTGCKKETVDPTPNNPNPTPTTVTDIDGNVYHTVTIGSQVWMVENFKSTHYPNGTSINGSKSVNYRYYNDDSVSYASTYGPLYSWNVINSLAPAGWHVPTDSDWVVLCKYLGYVNPYDGNIFEYSGGKLKETGTTHWLDPNTGATNESGFTALPGGMFQTGFFDNIKYMGYYWSSTNDYVDSAPFWVVHYDSEEVTTGNLVLKTSMMSVRLVHD